MIDPSFGTAGDNGAATMTPYPPTIQELQQRITDLETTLAKITIDRDFWQGKAHERMAMIDSLEEWLKDQFNYIDENITQSLVDIFGLEIKKEYDVQVTVTFSGVVTAPLGYDMDDLAESLDARLDASYFGDLEADFSEDNIDIDWTEA